MINLSRIPELVVNLDNELASLDQKLFEGLYNGVRIVPQNINLMNNIRYITVIRDYNSEEDEEMSINERVNSFEHGQILFSYDMFRHVNERTNRIDPGEEVVYILTINLSDNEIYVDTLYGHPFVFDVYSRYDFEFYRTPLFEPMNINIVLYDLKMQIVDVLRFNIEDDETQRFGNLSQNTKMVLNTNLPNENNWYGFNSLRNFYVYLETIELQFNYMDNDEEIEYSVKMNEYFVGDNQIINRDNDEVIILVNFSTGNNDDSLNQKIVYSVIYGGQNITVNGYYTYIRVNYNDFEPFIINRTNMYSDVRCYNNENFLWYEFEDINSFESDANRTRFSTCLGLNVALKSPED